MASSHTVIGPGMYRNKAIKFWKNSHCDSFGGDYGSSVIAMYLRLSRNTNCVVPENIHTHPKEG